MSAMCNMSSVQCPVARIGARTAAGSARLAWACRPRQAARQARNQHQQQWRAAAGAEEPACSSAAAAVTEQAAAPGSAAPDALPGLLQRLVACAGPADSRLLLLAAALGGWVLLGLAAAEPALAASAAGVGAASTSQHGAAAQLLGELAENEDFWGNVLRYASYFFSVLLGTVYVALRPLVELMKKPTTAVLVVVGLVGLISFVSFTVQAMLGVTEPIVYEPSSIVTPALSFLSTLH